MCSPVVISEKATKQARFSRCSRAIKYQKKKLFYIRHMSPMRKMQRESFSGDYPTSCVLCLLRLSVHLARSRPFLPHSLLSTACCVRHARTVCAPTSRCTSVCSIAACSPACLPDRRKSPHDKFSIFACQGGIGSSSCWSNRVVLVWQQWASWARQGCSDRCRRRHDDNNNNALWLCLRPPVRETDPRPQCL
jgi:hypothetical protein